MLKDGRRYDNAEVSKEIDRMMNMMQRFRIW